MKQIALHFCEQSKVIPFETDLIDDVGEYRIHREKPFIIIHRYIADNFRAWVYRHEIAHFIQHPGGFAKFSDAVTKRKIEKEANFAAAVALIPTSIVLTKILRRNSGGIRLPDAAYLSAEMDL